MAIDKAVDSAQLNAGLTTIADAIREKAGVSDNFTFPAGFAEAIAAIEAGGGGSVENYVIEVGTFTPVEPITTSYVIEPQTTLYAATGEMFICFRESYFMRSGIKGITVIGANCTRYNYNEFALFGGYKTVMGSDINNLNNHSITPAYKETPDYRYNKSYTINCSTAAPLSANTYTWLLIARKEAVVA